VLLWPTGMLSPCRDRSMTAYGGLWLVWVACAASTIICAASPGSTEGARVQSVMAATGLLYLASSCFGNRLVARAILAR